EAYGVEGEFRAPFAAAGAVLVPTNDGYKVKGYWDYATGCDVATHFLGATMLPSNPGEPLRQALLLIDRKDFSIVDNWQMFGMQGTGSKRVIISEELCIPDHRIAWWDAWSTPASDRLPIRGLENPIYSGRILSFLVGEATAVAVGTARGALDLYEEIVEKKPTFFPPFGPRIQSLEFQECFGRASALVDTAEAALIRFGQEYEGLCSRH